MKQESKVNKSFINNNRRGLYANMTVAKPYSREEKDFIKTFASALNHATAVIASNPSLSVSEGSIAHRIRREFSRLPPERQSEIGIRASALLSKSNEQRQRHFGVYSDLGAEVWSQAKPGLDDRMKQLLRTAVYARLDAQRSEIEQILSIGVPTNIPYSFAPSKTTLEVGFFGEVQAAWTSQTINSPIKINLRWETDAQEAERGVWQLYIGGGGQSGPEVQLGSGNAGPAPGGVFTIDLGNYLPPTPPSVPTVYRIRVIPKTNSEIVLKGDDGVQIPGKAVGLASNEVEITYSAVSTPMLEFDYYEYYSSVNFVLESIYMVEDSHESNTEEFHVAGFVQESFPTGSDWPGEQDQFGPMYAELDIDGPRKKNLSHSHTFNLGMPTLKDWPRAFSVIISVLEEDDGGSFNDWQSSLWTVADVMASGEISQAVKDYLQETFEDYIGDNIVEIINTGSQAAQMIVNLISSTEAGIIGLVVAAAAFIISGVVASLDDDYYGTEVFVFVLPSNLADYVHSLPGQPIDDGYILESQSLRFHGYPSWPEAALWDGSVDMSFHFELTGKEGTL